MKNLLKSFSAISIAVLFLLGCFSFQSSAKTQTFTNDNISNLINSYSNSSEDTDEYVSGEVVVLYSSTNSPITSSSLNNSDLSGKIKVKNTYAFKNTSATTSSTGSSNYNTVVSCISSDTLTTDELVSSFSELSNVAMVEPNYVYHSSSLESSILNDFSDELWGLNNFGQNGGIADSFTLVNTDINLDSLSDSEFSSDIESVIAVMDTGIDYTDSTLSSYVWTNPYQSQLEGEHGYNFLYDSDEYDYTSSDPLDDNGHGTHCAGIINSVTSAYGSNVKFMSLKWLDSNGSGTLEDILSAYAYVYSAQQLGVNVIAVNNSWNGGEYSSILDNIIDLVGTKGAVSVFSAGNDSSDNDSKKTVCSLESDYAVVVTAANESGELASFSNYGNESVDLAAPGTDILSTVSYFCFNPGIYDSDSKTKLCSNYNSYDISETPSAELIPGVLTYNTPSVLQDQMALKYDSENYFGDNLDDSNRSVKVTVDATAYQEYYIYIPYTVSDSTCTEHISTMIKCDAPVSDTVDELLGISYSGYLLSYNYHPEETYETADTSDASGTVANLEKFNASAADSTSGIVLNGESNYWEHFEFDNEATQSAETGYVIYYLYPTMDGTYTLYFDDFGVSKENIDVAETASYGNYDYYNGTSMACPYVTGAVGILNTLSDYSDTTSLQKANIIKSCVTPNSKLSASVSSDGMLDLSKLINDGYKSTPVISSVTVSGSNIIVTGSNLKDTETTINDVSCDTNVNKDGTILTMDGTDYINKYVQVIVSKNGINATKTIYLTSGKKEASTIQIIEDINSTASAITTTGDTMYFISDNTLYSYTPDDENSSVEFSECSKPDINSVIDSDNLLDDITNYNFEYSNQLTYINNYLYSIAAISKVSTSNTNYNYDTYLLQYDTLNDTWKTIKKITGPITNQTLGTYNGNVYLIGGYDFDTQDFSTNVQYYNPENGLWKNGVSLPSGRSGGKIIQSGTKLIYALGDTFDSPSTTDYGTSYITLPNTLIFDGKKWTTSSNELKAYNYQTDILNDTYYYSTNGSVSLCKNGVIISGLACEGYGDCFLYELDRDRYTATEYMLLNDLLNDTFTATTIGDTLYGFYYDYDTSEITLKSIKVTNGFVTIVSNFKYGTIETANSNYIPGSTIECTIKPKAKYYIKSMVLSDEDGNTAKVKNNQAEIFATSNVSISKKSIGRYVSK